MSITLKDCLQAIEARRKGVFDDPALMAMGPLLPDAEADVTEFKRRYMVESCGFTIGPRDPRLNRNYSGVFMAVEEHDESELPTDDGSNGPWCIVGDDLTSLVDDAFDSWAAEYSEANEKEDDDS